MRFVAVGLVLLALAIASSEYIRRNPRKDAAAEPGAPPAPKKLSAVLETGDVGPAPAAPDATGLLRPAPPAPAQGFTPVLEVGAPARLLAGGFGAVLFVVDRSDGWTAVRAEAGGLGAAVAGGGEPISAFAVDGSTAFFAQGGRVGSFPARGGAVETWARFVNGAVTSIAPSGDAVFVTVEGDGSGAVARVSRDGTVTSIAEEQQSPRSIVTDGKDVFWLAGRGPSLWRAPADGSFASRLLEGVDGPLAVDGDGVVVVAGSQVKRVPRAGGTPVVLADTAGGPLIASSGVVWFVDGAEVKQVSPGAEPSAVFTAASGRVSGLALGGTTLYVLVSSPDGATLWAKD